MTRTDVVASLRSARSLRSVSLAHPALAVQALHPVHLQALTVVQALLVHLIQALCTTSTRVMNAPALHQALAVQALHPVHLVTLAHPHPALVQAHQALLTMS